MSKIHNWLKYYRASLIDGSRGEKSSILPTPLRRNNSTLTQVDEKELEEIWDEQKIFKFNFNPNKEQVAKNEDDFETPGIKQPNQRNEEQDNFELTEINKIEIAPLFITSKVEHGDHIGDTKSHYPFWIPAYVDKKGKLYPPKEGETPIFIRNYLNPNPRDLPTIAEMEVLDKNLIDRSFDLNNWTTYWNDCERFFKEVVGKSFSDYQDIGNQLFSISKYEESNTTRNILKLYNDILFNEDKKKQKYRLLEKILEEKEELENHLLSRKDVFLNDAHYGQMNNDFPLSYSQRVAFAKFTSKHNNNIFAINGPPGTGKTTILQTVIANNIVQSVLIKDTAPLMVGCSTNNQAITNILDSMQLEKSDYLLTQRWLPEVNSFGLYLAASSKSGEASKKYQIETTSFMNDDFVRKLDDKAKILHFESYFRNKFQNFFIENIVDDFNILTYLFKKIESLKSKIDDTCTVGLRKVQVYGILKENGYKNVDDLKEKIKEIQNKLSENKDRQNLLNTIKQQLSERKKEFPFYVKIIPFKRFRHYRETAYKLITQPISYKFSPDLKWYKFHKIVSEIEHLLITTFDEQQKLDEILSGLEMLLSDISTRIQEHQTFIDNWLKRYQKRWDNLIEKTKDEYQNLDTLQDTAIKLDISYRNELFWLCVHYREWEYIQELKNPYLDNNKERGEDSYRNKLRRLAKITPLFISTFHTLPKFSNYYKYQEGNRFYKDLFDLMIIDESGQVSPEIAVPSLTFAKKILAVGDIHQIEPVWNVVSGVDYVNAEKHQVIKNEEDFEKIIKLGFTASSGSIMKMVKKSTPFSFKHTNGEEEKGTYLLEHRRCLDPIVEFSKDNVYHGSLKLMVGSKWDEKLGIPPLGYVHVDGSSQKHNGSSRKNIKEARTIVQWILLHKKDLESAYLDKEGKRKPIHEILAVITPFTAQKVILKRLLSKYFDQDVIEKLIIGTVHALQGAEKPIILFSAVHDAKDKSLFFDYQGKFNMLNVALTRAKHSFIVFGNMAVFNPYKGSPSGKLAKLLFSKEVYALDDKFMYESEIVYTPKSVNRIDTLIQHRKTLEKCFKIAQKELIIFSPFISIYAIKDDKVIELINDTTQRGVKVSILTDKYLDKIKNKLKGISELGRKAIETTKANLLIVNGIHNKTICVDDRIIIEGSFNWLSATRDAKSPYFRNETSVIIQGDKVKDDIEKIKTVFNI